MFEAQTRFNQVHRNGSKRKSSALVFIYLPILFLSMTGMAQTTSEESLKADREYLENMLMAPCCMRPLAGHESGIADRMREEITRQLNAGKTRDEILDAFVTQSNQSIQEMLAPFGIEGEEILTKPLAGGFNLTVYLMPIFLIALGILLVIILFKKFTIQQKHTNRILPVLPESEAAKANPHRRQIEEELKRYDF